MREHERQRDAFAQTVNYILLNPVRAELVRDWIAYPYIGALIPGYPDLDPRDGAFSEKFWKIKALVEE